MEPVRIECEPPAGAGPAAAAAADIVLLPGRAALLPTSGTLLVADLHLGKAAAFRQAGIPVPEGSAQRDLDRLERLVHDRGARRLLVLGDLFHARSGCTPQVFAEFAALRRRIAGTQVVLVLGNHDRAAGRLPAALGIDACLRVLDEPPFRFVHEPVGTAAAEGRELFAVGGHLHPTLSLRGFGADRLADRCFVAEPDRLVLPAFGSFTGGRRVEPTERMRFWIARDDGVADVTRLVSSRRR